MRLRTIAAALTLTLASLVAAPSAPAQPDPPPPTAVPWHSIWEPMTEAQWIEGMLASDWRTSPLLVMRLRWIRQWDNGRGWHTNTIRLFPVFPPPTQDGGDGDLPPH